MKKTITIEVVAKGRNEQMVLKEVQHALAEISKELKPGIEWGGRHYIVPASDSEDYKFKFEVKD